MLRRKRKVKLGGCGCHHKKKSSYLENTIGCKYDSWALCPHAIEIIYLRKQMVNKMYVINSGT